VIDGLDLGTDDDDERSSVSAAVTMMLLLCDAAVQSLGEVTACWFAGRMVTKILFIMRQAERFREEMSNNKTTSSSACQHQTNCLSSRNDVRVRPVLLSTVLHCVKGPKGGEDLRSQFLLSHVLLVTVGTVRIVASTHDTLQGIQESSIQ